MVEGKIDIEIVKIEAEAKVLVKKEQVTKGLQNKIRKLIRKKVTLHQRNQEINTTLRKISINLGNSIVLLNNKKKKTTFDVVVIEPIRNEEAEEKNKQTIVHHVSSTWLTDTQVRV